MGLLYLLLLPANILNNLPQTAEEGWSSRLYVGTGTKESRHLNLTCYKSSGTESDLDRSFGSGQGEMAASFEHSYEGTFLIRCGV